MKTFEIKVNGQNYEIKAKSWRGAKLVVSRNYALGGTVLLGTGSDWYFGRDENGKWYPIG